MNGVIAVSDNLIEELDAIKLFEAHSQPSPFRPFAEAALNRADRLTDNVEALSTIIQLVDRS